MARGTQLEELVREGKWAKVRKGLGRIKAVETIDELLYMMLDKRSSVPIDIVETMLLKRGAAGDCWSRRGRTFLDMGWMDRAFAVQSIDLLRLVLTHIIKNRYRYHTGEIDADKLQLSTGICSAWRKHLVLEEETTTFHSYRTVDKGINHERETELSTLTSLDNASDELKDAWERTKLIVGFTSVAMKLINKNREKARERDRRWEKHLEEQRERQRKRAQSCEHEDSDEASEEDDNKTSEDEGNESGASKDEGTESKVATTCATPAAPSPATELSLDYDEETTVHNLVICKAPPVVLWFALRLFPQQTLKRDDFGYLPLHYAIERFSLPRSLTSVSTTLPEAGAMTLLLNAEPKAAAYQNKEGETPLYHLTELSVDKSEISLEHIIELVHAEPRSLITRDVTTRLLPFMLLASCLSNTKKDERKKRDNGMKPYCSNYGYGGSFYGGSDSGPDKRFDILYTLIRENPSVITFGVKPTAYEQYLEAKNRKLEAEIAALKVKDVDVGSKRPRVT